ncbi:MAG TPA: 2-hydroxy-3-oxopropionate reductase [Solirubrobacter sp.]|nr:2-hydroxy-3-oxopropionate reductase [Solirubrobacter sp.]
MERIGFVGLGIMGAPMARNLVAAGYELTFHNRSRRELDGATGVGTARAVAERSDIVITMLPDSPDVEDVVLGADGVAEGLRSGGLLVDMSTVAPATARRVHAALAERGVDALDAPVSGGEAAACSGELSIMVGGSEQAVERARPLFDVLGKATTYVGPPGAGQVTKAANQVVVALTIQAVAEALLLARASGVDPARVREALLGGFAQSKVLEAHGQRMLDGAFDPGFRAALHRKDLGIALQSAREQHVPLLATAQAAELFNALIAQGDGDRDHSALALVYERMLR